MVKEAKHELWPSIMIVRNPQALTTLTSSEMEFELTSSQLKSTIYSNDDEGDGSIQSSSSSYHNVHF